MPYCVRTHCQMSMSVPETPITASKCVLTPMGVTAVLATLDIHSTVTEELAEVNLW